MPSGSPRYPDRSRRRLALPPAVIAVLALAAGYPFLEQGGWVVVRFAVAILALICAWFAVQARQWWWLPPLAAVAVLWNPVYPFAFSGPWWAAAQGLCAVLFLVVGATVRVRTDPDARASTARNGSDRRR